MSDTIRVPSEKVVVEIIPRVVPYVWIGDEAGNHFGTINDTHALAAALNKVHDRGAPPWHRSRFLYVKRAEGAFDVIDVGGATYDQFPAFIATCGTSEQAQRVVEALDLEANPL